MKNWVHRFSAAFAAAVLLAGSSATAPASAAEPFEINAILSLTGPFAFLGTSEATSLRTLEPLVNKKAASTVSRSTSTSRRRIAARYRGAAGKRHHRETSGGGAGADVRRVVPGDRTAPAANGPVQYCFAPTIHPPAGSYMFSGGASSHDQAVETLVFAKAKGWKRLAVVATTDATGQDISGAVSTAPSDRRSSAA